MGSRSDRHAAYYPWFSVPPATAGVNQPQRAQICAIILCWCLKTLEKMAIMVQRQESRAQRLGASVAGEINRRKGCRHAPSPLPPPDSDDRCGGRGELTCLGRAQAQEFPQPC